MATLADMQASVQLGDAAKAQGYWGQAVTHYQAAGQLGATDVGPQIDAKAKGATAGLTQRAWDMNGLLAQINGSDSSTQDDALQASKFITQMMQWYVAANAYAANPAAHADVTLPPLQVTGGFAPMPAAAPAAPPPIAPLPAPARPAVSKPVAPKPVLITPKKPALSFANALAAGALGVGGFVIGGPVAALVGAVAGGLGSKYLLKL